MSLGDYLRGDPLRLGHARQLLLDDHVVEDRFGVQRRLRRPMRHPKNPVLCADRPWEGMGVMKPSVVYEPDTERFRMWYVSGNVAAWYAQLGHGAEAWDPQRHGYSGFTCYAESDDGVHWRKPDLGVVGFGSHADTNIVFTGNGGCGASQVWRDDREADDARRYKMIYEELTPRRGTSLAWSADGIHWTPAPYNPLVRGHYDTRNHVLYDAAGGRWIMITRPAMWALGEGRFDRLGALERKGENLRRSGRRRVAVAVSDDLEHWSYPRTVFVPDETDVDQGRWDFDSMKVWNYEGLYLGFVTATDAAGENGIVRLAFSRDAVRWQQLPGHPDFLAPGREDDFDGGWITTVSDPILVGEKWWQYYGGYSRSCEMAEYETGIGLVRMHPEGLVEQYAGEEGGYLLTREFVLEGDRLEVNWVQHHPTGDNRGTLQVEILTRPGPDAPAVWERRGASGFEVVPGHSLDACDPVAGNHPHALVSWRGNPDLGPWRGQAVYLRFFLRNAGLYAFQVAGGEA